MNNKNDVLGILSKIDLKYLYKYLPPYKFAFLIILASTTISILNPPNPTKVYKSQIFIPKLNGAIINSCINIANEIVGLNPQLNISSILEIKNVPIFEVKLRDINGGSLLILTHRGHESHEMDKITNYIISKCNTYALNDKNRIANKINHLSLMQNKIISIVADPNANPILLASALSSGRSIIELLFTAEQVISAGNSAPYLYERVESSTTLSILSIFVRSILMTFGVILTYASIRFIYLQILKVKF